MDLPQEFISAAEIVFFSAWFVLLAALSVVAFGRDVLPALGRDKKPPSLR
jgi:hypothetical protein